MRTLLLLLSQFFLLSGCSYFHVHKMDIEQGNIITSEMLKSVHVGMSETEVRKIFGNPVLTNVFDKNSLTYMYTFKPGYGEETQKYVIFTFNHNRLSTMKENL